jgi:hypothetical protein
MACYAHFYLLVTMGAGIKNLSILINTGFTGLSSWTVSPGRPNPFRLEYSAGALGRVFEAGIVPGKGINDRRKKPTPGTKSPS